MKKTTNCLLCGAIAELKTDNFIGYQKQETFAIYHCVSCNTSFSLPRVDTTNIYNLIYQKGKEVPGYDRYWRYKETVKTHPNSLSFLLDTEESYWGSISALTKIVIDKQNTKILEVGCGMGYLTYSLIQAGYNATGLDISQEAVDEANRSFGNHYICSNIFEYSEQHKNEYDIVIMTEVIEHIETPVKFLFETTKLLKTKGYIILTTPNKTIYPNKVIWNTDLPPVHCWWLSEDSMKFIANKINCKVDFVHFNDYYRKNFCKLILRQDYPIYRFGEDGEVIKKRNYSFLEKMNYLFFKSSIIKNGKYSFCEKFAYLFLSSKIFKKILCFFYPKTHYICNEKGVTMCAIFNKLN